MAALKRSFLLFLFVILCFNFLACGGKGRMDDKTPDNVEDVDKEEIKIVDIDLSSEDRSNMEPYSITVTLLLSKKDADLNDYGITWYVKNDSLNRENNNHNLVQLVKKEGTVAAKSVNFDHAQQVKAKRNTIDDLIYFQAEVENLETGATYFWRCGNGVGVFSDVQTLEVKDKLASEFSFLYVSDTQNKSGYSPENYYHKALNLSQSISDYDFIIHTGDIVQEGKTDLLWKEMLDSAVLHNTPVMPVAGNHDYWSSYGSNNGTNDTYRHYRIKLEDQNNDDNAWYHYLDIANGMYYSYDYGDCHFIMLSTGDISSSWNKQLEWLKRDLVKNTKKWTILSLHEPFYSLGKYGSQTAAGHYNVEKIQNTLLPVIQGKVDLVLQGHDHILQYTYPLKDNGIVNSAAETVQKDDGLGNVAACTQYALNGGVMYAMAGAAGEQNRNSESNGSAASPKNLFAYCLANDTNRGDYYEAGAFFSNVQVNNHDITLYFYGFLPNSNRAKLITVVSITK